MRSLVTPHFSNGNFPFNTKCMSVHTKNSLFIFTKYFVSSFCNIFSLLSNHNKISIEALNFLCNSCLFLNKLKNRKIL